MRFVLRFRAIPLLVLLAPLGCSSGDGLPREAVSGAITIEGKPLKTGLVTFIPADSSIPTQSGANIIDGKFSIPKTAGLVPGKYKVAVSSAEGAEEKKVDNVNDAPGLPPILPKDAIPSQYGTNTILTAEVTAGGKNYFEFNLTRSTAAEEKN